MAIATAPKSEFRVPVPADMAPELVEVSEEENRAEIARIHDENDGAMFFRLGYGPDACENDAQRRGYECEERYQRNAWRYSADADTDSYFVRMGASAFDLDYIHERVGR